MPTKSSNTIKPRTKVDYNTKLAAIRESFGDIPLHPDEPEYVRFMYARRGLATVPGVKKGSRDLRYVIEAQDLQAAVCEALDRIRTRDGEKIFQEVAAHLIDGLRTMRSETRPHARRRDRSA